MQAIDVASLLATYLIIAGSLCRIANWIGLPVFFVLRSKVKNYYKYMGVGTYLISVATFLINVGSYLISVVFQTEHFPYSG